MGRGFARRDSPHNAMPSRARHGAIPTGKVCNCEQTAPMLLRYDSAFLGRKEPLPGTSPSNKTAGFPSGRCGVLLSTRALGRTVSFFEANSEASPSVALPRARWNQSPASFIVILQDCSKRNGGIGWDEKAEKSGVRRERPIEVKAPSPSDRLLLAFPSPAAFGETGLPIPRSENNEGGRRAATLPGH
jgi:hypothetical protein